MSEGKYMLFVYDGEMYESRDAVVTQSGGVATTNDDGVIICNQIKVNVSGEFVKVERHNESP